MDIREPAGLGNRILARILDSVIISLGTGLIFYLLYGEFINGNGIQLIDLAGLFYGLILPVVWHGYTLGRRMTGNRIVRIDERKIGIGTMLLRDIVAGVFYALTFGIGLIVSVFMVGIREDKRAIHDFIAGTYVTKRPPEKDEDVS
ncbi:RDD family protein [Virgibacillus senegalensis]|uniref:RDD family protein n=1 Tax=Virgibacillus senegalensis TaxID=1499679 RepID=UPI00069DC6B8|nr:RDD family protein [Virgibacillus senegalensis]